MKEREHQSMRKSANRLQHLARERADDEARRIPWQRLYDARNQYVDWQEFYLWVRSVLEVENRVPDWLAEILNDRCPGFLRTEEELTAKAAKNRPLPLRREDWIDECNASGLRPAFLEHSRNIHAAGFWQVARNSGLAVSG